MACYNKLFRKVQRTCTNCGQTFTGNYRARYCPNCYNEWKRTFTPIQCERCGKTLDYATGRKYCSRECYTASIQGAKRPQHAEFMREYMLNHPDQHVANHLRGQTYEQVYGSQKAEELRQHRSQISSQNWQNPDYVSAIVEALHIHPNNAELQLLALLKDNNLSFKYVGDFQLNLGGKFPDFVHQDKPLLIELFGEPWHDPEEEQERIEHFAQFGYNTLVIWCDELQDPLAIISRIASFEKTSL